MAENGNPVREKIRSAYKDLTLKNLYPGRYRAACKAPVVPGCVVFLEIREKELSDNFRMIRAALEKQNQKWLEDRNKEQQRQGERGKQDLRQEESGKQKHRRQDTDRPPWDMSVAWIGEGMENRGRVMRNCLKAIPKLARAQFVFVNEVSYFLSCLPVRTETTVIQTWHACGAFKKFGYSVIGKGFGTTREDLEKYPVHGNFSYVTVSAPEVVWAYAEAFHMEDHPERILPVGVSRTDLFFSRKYREKACGKTAWILRRMAPELFLSGDGKKQKKPLTSRQTYEQIPDVYTDRVDNGADAADQVVPGRKIILYAPTFRGSAGNASSPDRLDIPLMKKALEDDYILLINHHPFVKAKNRPKIPAGCGGFAFDMTDRLSIEELLTVADVCITDYSSLIFEYSLFERPLVFFAYDMPSYLDERGFYYPVPEMMPGPVCTKTHEIVDVLKQSGGDFDLARVRAFKYRFMGACDGHATSRVLRLMEECAARKG